MSCVTLAATLHDPDGAQLDQSRRVLPLLQARYSQIIVLASTTTAATAITTLQAAGLAVRQRPSDGGLETLGNVRADVVRLALSESEQHIHLCDWDRIIHWAEVWPAELETIVARIPHYDFLILGRTERAWNSHPRVQRDTETLINHVFGLVWGTTLDVTAASRGISPRAARRIVTQCVEPSIGNDAVWPLCLRRDAELVIDYLATEGLDWETPDRHAAAIARAGGYDAWLAAFDADPGTWAARLGLAQLEVAAIDHWCRPTPA